MCLLRYRRNYVIIKGAVNNCSCFVRFCLRASLPLDRYLFTSKSGGRKRLFYSPKWHRRKEGSLFLRMSSMISIEKRERRSLFGVSVSKRVRGLLFCRAINFHRHENGMMVFLCSSSTFYINHYVHFLGIFYRNRSLFIETTFLLPSPSHSSCQF